jgi:hypothetical protein
MPNGESTIFKLVVIGGLIGFARVLLDEPKLTARIVVGRVLLGSAVSMVAGLLLISYPDLGEIALIGAASALGIAGHTVVESLVKRYFPAKVKKEDKS